MTTNANHAFHCGADDHRRGIARNECPYDYWRYPELHIAWRKGWDSAAPAELLAAMWADADARRETR